MGGRGPGRAHRTGMTVVELLRRFPDDEAAERWFEAQRWPEGRHCPRCGSTRTVAVRDRRPMPYRCRDCRRHFSVRWGTVMQSSKLGLLREQGGLQGMSADQAVDLLRIMGRDQWDRTFGVVYPLVQGRGREDRMTVYRTLARHCIQSGAVGSER